MHANCRTDLSKRLPSSAAYILAKMELTSSGGPLYSYIERENVPESETESVITWSTIPNTSSFSRTSIPVGLSIT